jgi:hypothetical protein
MNPILICKEGSKGEDGHDAVPASIYDITITVSCSGVATKKKNADGTPKVYKDFNFAVDREAQFGHVSNELLELGIDPEKVEDMLHPWDMSEKYTPQWLFRTKYTKDGNFDEAKWVSDVLDKQSETLKKENPYEDQGETQQRVRSTPFGGRFRR